LSRLGLCAAAVAALFFILSPHAASADQCALRPVGWAAPLAELRLSTLPVCDGRALVPTPPAGKVIGSGIIYLYANDEAKYSSLNNVLKAVEQLQGKTIQPGETFSFNKSANLLQESIPYDLGPDVRNNLVKAGGVCMVSTMIATAAHDAGLPFLNERGKLIPRPVPHSRYYKYYHQVNSVNNRAVPITEAAIAIRKDRIGEAWKTVQDMQFTNNTGHVLVLHFEPSFTFDDLNTAEPFGLLQSNQTLKVDLLAVPSQQDAWLNRLQEFNLN
jgi:hypothetical protein